MHLTSNKIFSLKQSKKRLGRRRWVRVQSRKQGFPQTKEIVLSETINHNYFIKLQSKRAMNYNFPYFMFHSPLPVHPSILVFTQPPLPSLAKTSAQALDSQLQNVKKEEQLPRMPTPSHKKAVAHEQTDLLTGNSRFANNCEEEGHRRRREADSFTEKRNIVPNNINHILSYIQRKSKSESVVVKILNKLSKGNPKFTPKKFYCYQAYLKQKLHIHVNRETLRELVNHLELNQTVFTVEQQLFYNRVARTLICYYLRQLAKLKILSSQRVKLTSKLDHLKAQRQLLDYMTTQTAQS